MKTSPVLWLQYEQHVVVLRVDVLNGFVRGQVRIVRAEEDPVVGRQTELRQPGCGGHGRDQRDGEHGPSIANDPAGVALGERVRFGRDGEGLSMGVLSVICTNGPSLCERLNRSASCTPIRADSPIVSRFLQTPR